jgi:hypothetical protein
MIKSLINRMHSASSYSVHLYRPQPIPAVVAHPGSVATGQTSHTTEILSPRLKTKSGVSTGIAMNPNGATIDPRIDGAISSTMNPAASIPRSLAGTTIDIDMRGVTIKSGTHPPVQRINSSTIYNAHSSRLRAIAAPVLHPSRSMTSCQIMGMAKTVAPKPATRSGSARKCWNDCGGTLIGCFNRQRLRDEARAPHLQPELIIQTEDYYRSRRSAGFAVGFPSRASFCASSICASVICFAAASRPWIAS